MVALVQANPGSTVEDAWAAASAWAAQNGGTVEQALDALYAQSERSLAAASVDPIAELLAQQIPAPYGLVDEVEDDPSGVVTIEHVPPVASSGGGDNDQIHLGNANKRADIFVAPASTLGQEHGHTGVYYYPDTIIEAPGVGQVSHRTSAAEKSVTAGVQIQKVVKSDGDRIGTDRRAHVADWANGNLLDKEYRILKIRTQ